MKSTLSDTNWSAGAWAAALAVTLVLLVGAVSPPFVSPGAEGVVRAGFQHLCHQLPGRSFSVGGIPLAVCQRCTGIYGGLVVGALLLPSLRVQARQWTEHDRWVLLAAVLPALIDWGGDVIGLWSNTVGTRFVTGLWLGVIVGFVFARSLAVRLNPRGTPSSESVRTS